MPMAGQRLDKWLWFARIVKSRTLAARLVASGKVRVNRSRVTKAAYLIRLGDVITATLNGAVCVLRIEGLGARRGPAPEARSLYDDLTPPNQHSSARALRITRSGLRLPGAGRPTKRERRELDRFLQRR
jgi:ribosome-associated heat shock protein Hsp15